MFRRYAKYRRAIENEPLVLCGQSNRYAGAVQDRRLLDCLRCAVYFAETSPGDRNPDIIKSMRLKFFKRSEKIFLSRILACCRDPESPE